MTLESGDRAPTFTLPDETGRPVSLGDYEGSKLVLYFYPKAFTPGCTSEACDFRDRYETFQAGGYEIIGISPDPVDKLARFREEYELPFPLLSDEDHAVAQAYGAWGVKKNYGREYEGIIRSTFLINGDGTIERAWRNVRAKGHGERIAREVTTT